MAGGPLLTRPFTINVSQILAIFSDFSSLKDGSVSGNATQADMAGGSARRDASKTAPKASDLSQRLSAFYSPRLRSQFQSKGALGTISMLACEVEDLVAAQSSECISKDGKTQGRRQALFPHPGQTT